MVHVTIVEVQKVICVTKWFKHANIKESKPIMKSHSNVFIQKSFTNFPLNPVKPKGLT